MQDAEQRETNSVAGKREKEQGQNGLQAGQQRGIEQYGCGDTGQQRLAPKEEDQEGDGREENAI